jgi:hypothetical protein
MVTKKELFFEKGKEYRMKTFVNPVWPPGQASTCMEILNEGRMGYFTNGDDVRWWTANADQFEEAK